MSKGWAAILTLLVAPWTMVLNGLVLSILWEWFIVPVFHAPSLHIATAIGLALVVSYLTAHVDDHPRPKGEEPDFAYTIVISILRPMIALALGAVVHLFV